MSRFFRAGESDSDDTESDYSEELSNSESEDHSDSDSDDSSSDDDDAGKKVGRGRLFEGSFSDSDSEDDTVRVVRSAKDKRFEEIEQAVNSMANGQKINDWVSAQNEFDRANKGLQKAAGIIAQTGIPKFYIKAVADLEKSIQAALEKEKSASKKMNASNAKALNSMKQKVKKNNRLYEKEIQEYEKDPENYAVEEEVVEEKPKAKKTKKVVVSDSEDESDAEPADDGFTPVGAGGKTVEFTQENIYKKLREVADARGKKNTNREEQARILERLLVVANSPYQKIRVLLALISAQFDFAVGVSGYMTISLWKNADKYLNNLLTILESNPEYIVKEDVPEEEETEKDRVPQNGEPFTKSLQNIDPHTTDYVDRLKDEVGLYTIIVRSQAYFTRLQLTDSISRTTMRRLEHLYFKPDVVIVAVENATAALLPAQ
ncbi:Translation initiation factor 3 subunit c, partial [Mortierella sp. GBA35]